MTAPRMAVRVSEHVLTVEVWHSKDLAVLAAAQQAAARGENLDDWLARVIAIGAAAVSTAGTTSDLARIDSALHRLDRQVSTSLDAALARLNASVTRATDPETGDVARAAQGAVDRLAAGVQRVLTGSGALLPEATTQAVGKVTDRALSEIHRLLEQDRQALASLVATDRERTAVEVVKAVSTHNAEFAAVVSELRLLLANRATDDARASSGPHKGLSYESDVHDALHELASAAGDGGATRTGGQAGADGTRKGDSIVDLRSLTGKPKRLVVEMKNRPGRAALSSSGWATELEQAMRARQADVAIGICPAEQMPGSNGVFVIDSRRMVVAWDPEGPLLLGPAYLLMRMAAAQHSTIGPDQAEVEADVRAIAASLKPLDDIQRQAGTCRRAVDKIDATAGSLRDAMATRIQARSLEAVKQPAA